MSDKKSTAGGGKGEDDLFTNDFECYLHTIVLPTPHPPRTGPLVITGSLVNSHPMSPTVTVSLTINGMPQSPQPSTISGGTWTVSFPLTSVPPTGPAIGEIKALMMCGTVPVMAFRSFTFASA